MPDHASFRTRAIVDAITHLQLAEQALKVGYTAQDGTVQTNIHGRAGYAEGAVGTALDLLAKCVRPNQLPKVGKR